MRRSYKRFPEERLESTRDGLGQQEQVAHCRLRDPDRLRARCGPRTAGTMPTGTNVAVASVARTRDADRASSFPA